MAEPHAQANRSSPRVSKKDTSGSLLDNIIESTRCLIHHNDPSLHISTFAEREALTILKQYGSVLITGKSGSGKSRIGYRLLSEIERSTHRIPLVLTSYRQWHHIPQDRNKHKYVAFIDDIFGNGNLVQSQLEGWRKLFSMMQPAVESGHIKLVLSSRNEIYQNCPQQLKQHPILHNSEHVFLDEHKYALRKTEKVKFIQKYCNNITNLHEEEIERLTALDPPLGFPQCCVFFAQNKPIQERGIEFFQKPYEFIARDICVLQERDPTGYLVLLLVIMTENRLDTRHLMKPSAEFKEMIDMIANTCIQVFRPPSCAQIRDKLKTLCDVYLFESNQVISFQHQSIFEAVFVNAARDNQEIFLQHCPATVLLEYVFTESKECMHGVQVEEDMFPALAKRITELMLSSEVKLIIDHPSLKNPHFIKTILTIWTKDVLFQLSTQLLKQEDMRMLVNFDNGGSPATETALQGLESVVFSYKEFISILIIKGLCSLAKQLIPVVVKQSSVDEALICAAFKHDFDIVASLLDKGACVSNETLTAVCCSKPKDRNVTDLVFSYFKRHETAFQKPERKFSLAIQQGNIFAVEHLIDILSTHEKKSRIFSDGLDQLVFQCGKSDVGVPYVPSTSIPVVEIMQLLLSTNCSYMIEYLVSAAARHEESSSLKYLLDFIDEHALPCDLNGALFNASLFGTADSVKLLLQKGAFEKTSLVAAAKSSESSSDKLRLLLESLHEHADVRSVVNMKENGYVPLHFAVAFNNFEGAKLLLNSEADMNIESGIGITSFQLAAYTCNVEILQLCLEKLSKGSNLSYKGPVTHFVVETVQHIADVANRKGILLELLKFLPKAEVHQKKSVNLLVQFGIDVNELDEDGRSAIFVAAGVGNTQMVKHFHAKGARVDVISKHGSTVLHVAAKYGGLEMVKFLCERGCEVNMKDHSGQSVLHQAAGSDIEALEKMKYLLDVRCTPLNDAGGCILQTIPSDNIDVAQHVIELVLSVAEIKTIMKEAFHHACRQHSHNILEYMIKVCNDEINPKTSNSPDQTLNVNTGLHFAVQTVTTNGPVIVNLLLENAADVSVTDEEGNTALLLSLITLKNRADNDTLDIEDRLYHMDFKVTGLSAQKKRADARIREFDDLMHSSHLQVIKLLIEQNADVNVVNNRGQSPLHLASQIHHPVSAALVSLLTLNGAHVNARDRSGNTALHYAVRNDCSGNHEMIAALMEAGTNVNEQNDDGKTAVDIILGRPHPYKRRNVKEMRKLRIILERCSSIEGQDRDMLYSETFC